MPRIAAAIRDSATLWNAIQGVASDYIVVIDPGYVMRFVNRTGGGFSHEQVVGHSILDFTTDESRGRLQAAIDEVFATGGTRSLRSTVRWLDGEVHDFTVRIGPVMHQGEVTAAVVCSEDITELTHVERDLQRERSILRRLIDIQEKERQLVSYEIHDGLAQYLAGAIMHLEAHLHQRKSRPPRELVEGIRLLRAAAEESRRLIAGLRPPALDELGIVAAIESLVADARIEIPHVEFTHDLPDERLPATVETSIFRLVQESLTNVRRHAHAQTATVELARVPDGVRVRVRDDGRGFDPATVSEQRFGLEGIRQRCRLQGAEPRIESAPGRGTTIEAVLPV